MQKSGKGETLLLLLPVSPMSYFRTYLGPGSFRCHTPEREPRFVTEARESQTLANWQRMTPDTLSHAEIENHLSPRWAWRVRLSLAFVAQPPIVIPSGFTHDLLHPHGRIHLA